MAFWGVEVKPGKPITHSCEKARGRLRISQATLGIGEAAKKTVVQCNVGSTTPVLLCALLPNNTESCHLDLEFEEADDVIFSVIGPRTVYLTGYYVRQNHQSNAQSDTESYGVDIENTPTEGSSYGSDDDKYEDSFIDDDDELQVSPPSPVSSIKETGGTTPQKDKPKDKKGGRRLKKKFQVIDTDDDANSCESDEDDGYLLSVFKNKKTVKTTKLDDGEKTARVTMEMDDSTKNDGQELKEKVGSLDIDEKPTREAKRPLNGVGTQVKDELPKEVATLEQTIVNEDRVLTDGNKAESNVMNENLLMNGGDDHTQSLDLNEKPKKRRKERSKKEEETCKIEVDREKKEPELEDSKNLELALVPDQELGSDDGHKSKKRRKERKLEETCEEGNGLKCPKDGKIDQELLVDDSIMKDPPTANGECQEQIPSHPKKKNKKKMKKAQDEGNLSMDVLNTTDKQEKTSIKSEVQSANLTPINTRTLSNGLMIEVLANGQPDGKVAAPGKKVKIYYTAMLKESGRVFDSNVGKTPCKFRLGNEDFIDGWNMGIEGMYVGEKRRLTIPPSMGFGNHGGGENVPPNSWLVYEVELVGVHK